MTNPTWMDTVKFDEKGLVPAVVQDAGDGTVLMVAFMNRDSLAETLRTGRTVFWSRSRGKFWRKGEESGRIQEVVSVDLDCDLDTVLVKVTQTGGAACHTGRRSCFHNHAAKNGTLEVRGEPLFDPAKVYKKKWPSPGHSG